MGGCCLFMWGGKLRDVKNITYVVVLDGQVTIFHVQQPTKNMRMQWSGFIRAGATRAQGGVRRGDDTIVLGALEVERR